MKIIVDSREQAAYDFRGYDATIEKAALSCGDYSIPGFADHVAVERKELNDLIGCLMDGRERFEKELSRAQRYSLFCVVIEASLNDVAQGNYRSAMKPHSALQSIIAMGVRYRVPFLWCGSRQAAEYCTYWMLQKYLREIEQRFKQATKGQKEGAA